MGRPGPSSFEAMLRKRGVPEEDIARAAQKTAAESEPVRALFLASPRPRAAPPRAYKFFDMVGAEVFYIPKFILPQRTKEERAVLHLIRLRGSVG